MITCLHISASKPEKLSWGTAGGFKNCTFLVVSEEKRREYEHWMYNTQANVRNLIVLLRWRVKSSFLLCRLLVLSSIKQRLFQLPPRWIVDYPIIGSQWISAAILKRQRLRAKGISHAHLPYSNPEGRYGQEELVWGHTDLNYHTQRWWKAKQRAKDVNMEWFDLMNLLSLHWLTLKRLIQQYIRHATPMQDDVHIITNTKSMWLMIIDMFTLIYLQLT